MESKEVAITFQSYVRIGLGIFVRLTLGSYIIKQCKWNQKITKYLRLEITSVLRHKNWVRIRQNVKLD